MSGFAEAVRVRVDDRCLTAGIGRKECGVLLADAPAPRIVIDLDATGSPLGAARVKCDYLFFSDPDLVMPIEIKDHGAPDVAKANKQLQAGADAADKLVPRDRAVRLRPVLVSRDMRRDNQNALRRARVRFRRNSEMVRRLICGDPLTAALGHS